MSSVVPFPDDDPDIELVDEVLDKVRGILGEHFDTGVVLLTRQSPEGITSYHSTEFGNKFAMKGMVESYMDGELSDIECELEDDDD
jgi:hypothetical protein